ncbi:MAG: type II secretion system F family protein [Alphaproteobacteria bacterium]|nr:type II secretion system F family protein [Alphaproteobacteria bacterium]
MAQRTLSNPMMKSLAAGALEVGYAHVMLRMHADERLQIYRKLGALLKNRFSLMDALERIYSIASKDGKDPGDSMAIASANWMQRVRNGSTFSEALQGWVPSTEILMLSVGDVASLELALQHTVRVVEGMNKMRSLVMGAVSYPLFLMFMVCLLIWGVAKYMVPPMVSAVPNLHWTGVAKSLVDLSVFVDQHPLLLFSILPVIVTFVSITFPFWKGKSRALFDNVPPWSIYRVFIGVSWLLALSALVRAGMPVSRAMKALSTTDASPYLRYRIDKALSYINNGDNLGEALYHTQLKFPDSEIVGDLRIYAELDTFPEALENLANTWLEGSIRDIDKKASILNSVAILMIAAVIAWVVWGTFEMQDQMVSGMGLGSG